MLLFVGLAFKIKGKKEIFTMLIVGIISSITNLAVGFRAGLILFFLLRKLRQSRI